jgi:hypothetical protein
VKGKRTAKEALFLRDERRDSPAHRNFAELVVGQPKLGCCRRLAAYKALVRYNCHCTRNSAILVDNVFDVDVVQT